MNDPKDFLDYGDDGKRVIVTTGSAEHAAELRAALRASAHDNGTEDMRVLEIKSLEPLPPVVGHRTVLKGRSVGISSVKLGVALAALGAAGLGAAQSLRTGRDLSRRRSQEEEERRLKLRKLRESYQGRVTGFDPALAAPYGRVRTANPTQQDLDRIAAAEAKRARKAAKRSK